MLFKINQETLEEVAKENKKEDKKEILEKDLEKLIISTRYAKDTEKYGILSKNIFGEELFFIKNQVSTGKTKNNSSKYADIIAIDKQGNGVIIELKKDTGNLGVEMQALQYAVLFSAYKGEEFLKKIYKKDDTDQAMKEALMSFLDENTFENINKKSRIILLASGFNDSVYAMGEWLNTQGVSFKCISYEKYTINSDAYLSFSVAFNRSQDFLYRIQSAKAINTDRDPAIFFHIVGDAKWEELIKHKMIPCGFDGRLNDRGTQIMRNYIKDDTIIAYKSGKGILGYGVITEPASRKDADFIDNDDDKNYDPKGGYQLFKENSPIGSPHTQKVKWEYVLSEEKAIKTTEFEKQFEIYHPIQTSSRIRSKKAEELLKLIEDRFEEIS
jgi:hypothetical protein